MNRKEWQRAGKVGRGFCQTASVASSSYRQLSFYQSLIADITVYCLVLTAYCLLLQAAVTTYSAQHLIETSRIVDQLQPEILERMADLLVEVRERGGRLFFLGVGGSAANASHAVNDFRKIAGFECYAPTDNVSELTARTNDECWASVFVEWLRGSRLRKEDAVFVFSVGGGNLEKNVSPNLVSALQYAKEVGAVVLGVVGRDGGYTARVADVCCVIPIVNPGNVTPHSEAFQGVVWHLLVSHPKLKVQQTKWEATAKIE
jgi:D-sedoheptulose 7-phosphate isomerase